MDVKVYGEVKLKLELPDALMALLERCVAPHSTVEVQPTDEKVVQHNASKAEVVPDTLPEPTVEVKPVEELPKQPAQTGVVPVAAPQESNISCDDLRKHITEARKLARAHGNDILSNTEIKAKMESTGAAKMTDLTGAQIAAMFAWVDEVSSNA